MTYTAFQSGWNFNLSTKTKSMFVFSWRQSYQFSVIHVITAVACKTIVNESIKCEISQCALRRNAITGVIHCVSAHRLSCCRGRDETACRYKTESLFHYCETAERKQLEKKESRDSAQQSRNAKLCSKNFFPVCPELRRDKKCR